MASLLKLNPKLLTRIAFAPRPVIHGIGAWLYFSNLAQQSDAVVAEILYETDPRDLLRAAIPNAPSELFRALDGAGDSVQPRSFYERISKICSDPLAQELFSGGRLNCRRLDHIELLLAVDPIIPSIQDVMEIGQFEIEALDVLIKYARAHKTWNDLQVPHGAGLPWLLRSIEAALSRMTAPPASFALTPPYTIVGSVQELREVGARLDNCVKDLRRAGSDHWLRLAEGSRVYIECLAPPLLAVLKKVGPGIFFLDEIRGRENCVVDDADVTAFKNSLIGAGVEILRGDPVRAMRALGRIENNDRDEDGQDIEDTLRRMEVDFL